MKQQLKTVFSSSVIFILSLICFNAHSQSSVEAKTDTMQIRIGEQFHLDLTAKIPRGSKLMFPLLTDTFNHFEVVKKSGTDTLGDKGSKELTLKQQLTLTSFDSGYFVIPPLPFVLKNNGNTDTLSSEAILMTVTTVKVDTTKDIRTIKNIVEVPFPWLDYLIYLIAFIVVAAIVIFLIRRANKNKFVIGPQAAAQKPAHALALEKLNEIKEQNLWQQGFVKKYYSEITDALRLYIERRFKVFAMEQTTDEILIQMPRLKLENENIERLTFILRTADMVKFAKGQPLPPENERAIADAFAFVNSTIPVVKPETEKSEVKS